MTSANRSYGKLPYRWRCRRVGYAMKQISIYGFYDLGKILSELNTLNSIGPEGRPFKDVIWTLWQVRYHLDQIAADDSILLDSSRRAVNSLLAEINSILPTDEILFAEDHSDKHITAYHAGRIVSAWSTFETIFNNDMPGMATYSVVQKGIYRTEDLIAHADNHLPKSIRDMLPDQAKKDLCDAGKCLAFEVPTASAFHLWRALESVMGTYFVALTGSTFEQGHVSRNWGAYIKALNDKGADHKVTAFLDHIREEYRNPVSHPNENVDLEEAFTLFGVSVSAITRTIVAIRAVPINRTPKPKSLLDIAVPGFDRLGALAKAIEIPASVGDQKADEKRPTIGVPEIQSGDGPTAEGSA